MKKINLTLVALIALAATPALQASEKENIHIQEQQAEETISNTKVVGMSIVGSIFGFLAGNFYAILSSPSVTRNPALHEKPNLVAACTIIGAIAAAARAYTREKRRVNKVSTPSTADIIIEETTSGAVNTTILSYVMFGLGHIIYPHSYDSTHDNSRRILSALGGLIGLGITYNNISDRLEKLKKKDPETMAA